MAPDGIRQDTRGWSLACALVVAGGVAGIVSGVSAQTWEGGAASAEEACRAKVDEDGAFEYSRVDVRRNVADCYVKARDGTGDDSYATAVSQDEPPPVAPQPEEPPVAKIVEGDDEKVCEDLHPGMTECYELEGRGLTLGSFEEGRAVLVRLNPGLSLSPEKDAAEKCDTRGSHWNFQGNGKFVGSVLCCECCRNTAADPVVEERCGVYPN